METRAAPDAPEHRTTIRVVVVEGQPYIRSFVGPGARWYREVLASPEALLHVGSEAIPVTVIHAPDAASIAACSQALVAKYEGDPATPRMVRAEVLETTLRLEPMSATG